MIRLNPYLLLFLALPCFALPPVVYPNIPYVYPTQAHLLIRGVTGTAFSLAITGLSITGGFTILDQVAQSAGNCEGLVTAYLVQTTATAANPTLNWTNSAGTGGANATFQ